MQEIIQRSEPIQETKKMDLGFVFKAIRLTEPVEDINKMITLSLGAKKIRDYSLASIDSETLTSIFDVDEYLDDCGVNKENRGPYYVKVEEQLKELRATATFIPIPNPSNPDYSISALVSWVNEILRIDNRKTKTGRKYAIQFNPIIRPNIINLHECYYKFCKKDPVRITGDFCYELYQFLIAREYLPQPICYSLRQIFSIAGIDICKYTKKTTALKEIRDAVTEINEKSDITVSLEFGKRPVSEVYFYITRKYGTCASVGKSTREELRNSGKEACLNTIKQQICYDNLTDQIEKGTVKCHASHLDIVVACMYEVLFEPNGPYKINKTEDFPLESLQNAYQTIEKDEVIYALESVYKKKGKLEHPIAFYRTTLYNAALQGRAYADSKKQSEKTPVRQLDADEMAAITKIMAGI